MKSKFSVMLLFAVTAVSGFAVSRAQAQDDGHFGSESTETRVMPYVMPGGGSGIADRPRLGFYGTMINGYGMRVDYTTFGMPAQRAGLESGDVIWQIEGRRILCQHDFDDAMRHAGLYHGGWVNMIVRNVRFDMGMSPQQFVNVSARAIGSSMMAYESAGTPGGGLPPGYMPYSDGTGSTSESGVGAGEVGSDGSTSGDF
jgi:hypothetical protein